MIPWFVPLFDEADNETVRAVMASTFLNQGERNVAFERRLREYFGCAHAVLTPNGTTALALSLMAAGIGPGDTVIVPDLTFVGTASAVRLAGAEVILADVDKETFTLDPDDAARRIQPSTRALLPVHLTGRSANMDALHALAKKHNLLLLEDAAEAIGAKNQHGFLGTQSVAGGFSLAPTKIITSGQGGFVLTNRKDIYEQIVRLKDHGRLSRASDVHPVTGFNFKLTDLQAALAHSQFDKLDARIARSLEVDALYRELLRDVDGLSFPPRQTAPGSYLMWPDFVSTRRDPLCAWLKERDIHLRPFWPPLHTQPAYRDHAAFPGADYACSQACWLPSSPALTNEEIHTVAHHIHQFFSAQHRS